MKTHGTIAVPLLFVLGAGCEKVPIVDVAASFSLADVSWFEAEETLFVFYEVYAEQGIGDLSVVEIQYTTDDGEAAWTDVDSVEPIHTHLPVDCGSNARCGSVSLHVPLEPRDVSLRLRYHQDGELALSADTQFHVVGAGPAHISRSLLVYGVFDESNRWVQWRGRHQFPALRNEEAEALGLRRDIRIREQRHGTSTVSNANNPYGYGRTCPTDFLPLEQEDVYTNARAAFNATELPTDVSESAMVCASATVVDALGAFSADAFARKNPEVRTAFPALSSPIEEATQLPFFLAPCQYTISTDHAEMQRQRLMMEDVETWCIDDWQQPGFADTLAAAFWDAVEAERPAGNDMVLVVGLHQDEDGVSEVVEEALSAVVLDERHRASPRLAGAFVFDSEDRGLSMDELSLSTLWCPSQLPDLNDTSFPDASVRTCPVLPDLPQIDLGPFSFASLPVLAPRDQYLSFIDTFSKAQAGSATALSFLTPTFATTADHIDYGDFGVVTFFNEERIDADRDDAFSYCIQDETQLFAFRSALLKSPQFQKFIAASCDSGKFSEDICALAASGVLPIELLPDWHNSARERGYELGMFWDFPFLTRMEYETVSAGSIGAFGLSVPFGFAADGEAFYGTQLWTQDTFVIDDLLGQCRRFCEHPTFDSAGVYHVTDDFRTAYATTCYAPVYPAPGDSGFPSDP